MKKSVLATFIMYSALTMQAQEIILASGGNATGSGGSVSYSIGQVFYNTNTSTEGSIEEGVQIPVFKLKFTNGSWLPMAPSASTGSNEVFVIDGIYTVTTDVAVKDLDLSSGAAVVVEPNHTLNINGDLTMNSISNSFSSLVVKGNAPVAGSSIYHRYVNAQLNRNDLITPPMDGQSWSSFLNNNSSSNASALFTNGLTGMSTLYLFGPYEKGSTDDYLIYSNSTIATLTAGKGYRAATNTATINGNGETLTFEGSVLTSPVNVDIVDDQTGNYAEWNLVGNPFPAYLDITEFLNHEVSPGVSNLSLLDANSAAIYGYDGDDTDGSFWTITNLVEGPILIAPGQGFFVSSKNVSSQLQFTSAMQVAGSSDDFIADRFSSTNTTGLKIKLQSAENNYTTSLYFNDNTGLGLDPGYDAAMYGTEAPAFSIYSHLVEDNTGLPMAIQAFDNTDISDISIPLGINASQGTQLNISIEDANLPETISVYLEDNQNSSFTLLNTTDYTFAPNENLNGTGRFFLHFQYSVLGNPESIFKGITIYSVTEQQQIVIKGQLTQNTTFKLFDVNGRLILSTDLDKNKLSQYIDTSYLSKGVYVLQLLNNQQQLTQKMILQ